MALQDYLFYLLNGWVDNDFIWVVYNDYQLIYLDDGGAVGLLISVNRHLPKLRRVATRTLSIMTLRTTTFSIMPLSITTFNITIK